MPANQAKDSLLELALSHGLSRQEYRQIQPLLKREPNQVEVGIFSAMWSEHCSYKSSRLHLKKLPSRGERVIYGPGENAGVVAIDDNLALAFKMESHNHPSSIEPFQGAATGVGGIIRDIFTMGARPIALLNSLCFGPLEEARNRYLLSQVVAGIAWYGNCMGIPTVGGETRFAQCYRDNCLVNVFCLGLVEQGKIFTARAGGVDNPVIYVGSATGRDGIHGATMASQEFDEGADQLRPTVQVGDPFTEKLLLEACLEAMGTGCLVGIQDMGAAGLTCSSVEMADRGGMGIELDLSRVPVRERGMDPYELMLSESQERMLLVARQGSEEEIKKVFEKWGLPAVVVGKVTPDGNLRVMKGDQELASIPTPLLTSQAPVYDRSAKAPAYLDEVRCLDLDCLAEPKDYSQCLLSLLASPAIASKGWIFRQYDHMVGLNTVIRPGADAALLRVKGTAKGIALTVDGNGRFCYLDPRTGSGLTVCEAARNLACVGARPLALTDCLNFGNPEKPEVMWQFSQAIEGMRAACQALGVPVVSGNVSFYNETSGQGIYPTPTVAMVGLMQERSRYLTCWFKNEGDVIVLLGTTGLDIGGSEYLNIIHGRVQGTPPPLDLGLETGVILTCLEAVEQGLINSAHDCSDGGLAVALAECCLGPDGQRYGAKIALAEEMRLDGLLFGESSARIVVSLEGENLSPLQSIAKTHKVPVKVIGEVTGNRLRLGRWIDLRVEEMEQVYTQSLEARLATEKGERGR
ncbi:MAG: phosphoribosylformylglycinamidine synthase subunit PurL [Thermodesulfobacteriota bacterium]